MAAAAYLGGPITALVLLILETQNDYVRFHAYQSALLTTPLLALILFFHLVISLPAFLQILLIIGSVGITLWTSFRAWKDAQEGLSRYWLPYIGEVAERWVSEEKNYLSLPLWPTLILTFLLGIGVGTLSSSHRQITHQQQQDGFTSSAFRIDKSQFLPAPPLPERPSYLPEPVQPKVSGMVVPNALHYVYGLKPVKEGEKVEELPYYAYLAIRSAIINLRPEMIFFHHQNVPTGPWWDEIVPHLTLIKTQVPDSYLGRKLSHFAHKADVLRLLAMKYSGGIYLDIDMFV
ncbi:hypothetical protein BD324DRAFT_641634 [Kockovaella imperatae]|uniref:Uncharacterized protein n=1 Tax=Kockovaella imperatae TaxID=4999 RepID=A0A1Y1ULY9_9TREE|nr:hypothetical protein BD324DRAFT_641634 [Kockovaella imperatae]ORX38504.1 hypothetical protein BD324DRAFT_641634 [Kockovaella imperatae]